tara:strand:- start:120 stop:779 length:660 start_codon:yes stop_codon:yes gene_type:complete
MKIGVLGGIGPESTIEFYSKLIKTLQKQKLIKNNQDFPHIFINSIPAPELINEKFSEKELKPYIKGLKELDKFNPDIIVIICNTLYTLYDRLQKEIKTPILNLRKEVEKQLKKENIVHTLIIATPTTINQGLFKFKGIDYIKPNKEEQKQLTNAIFNFNKGINKDLQKNKVLKICKKYKAEKIILGCTEFGVMLNEENIKKINTIDTLVNSTINNLKNK